MSTRWQLPAVTLCLILAAPSALDADIYRWDNGQVIPGTEGITPGPGVQLDHRQLEFAQLSGSWENRLDLTGANFDSSNLTNAELYFSILDNANFSGAVVMGAVFGGTVITQAQLYSTQSYQVKNLSRIGLTGNDLTGWDFSGQNLTDARLGGCKHGECGGSDLSNASFLGAKLVGASLAGARLMGVNLSGAVVTGASFERGWDDTGSGLTQTQLQSTASYQMKDLHGIGLVRNDLTGWDFSGQNLSGANLDSSTLTNANLTGAVVTGASFRDTTSRGGFTQAQLASTATYRAKDLHGIRLDWNELSGWDFSGQNLTGANLGYTTLTNTNLAGANLKNAYLEYHDTLASAIFDAETLYNQWTVFPSDFDPIAAGLTRVMSPTGDLNADDAFDVDDVDMLASKIRLGHAQTTSWLPDAAFDTNSDSSVNLEDHRVWVKNLAHTWYGDADLNGEFNSNDFVQVFQAGKYERAAVVDGYGIIVNPVGWSEGDWNADGFFDSSDFITAFVDGGYEQGPRPDVAAVPEPGGVLLLILGLASVMRRKTTAQNRV